MNRPARYAVYFVPDPASVLARLGSALLGRDSETGLPVPQPCFTGFPPETLRALTAQARRYGLHATLKAPFFLQPGATERDLLRLAQEFAASQAPIALPWLGVERIGSFFALVPRAETPAEQDALRRLNALAADAVTLFDPLRAAASEREIARRNPQALSARQRELLTAWGYPYVFDEYRFHITLTDRLFNEAEAGVLQARLQAHVAALEQQAVAAAVASLCICRQTLPDPATSGEAPFTLLQRFDFPPPKRTCGNGYQTLNPAPPLP